MEFMLPRVFGWDNVFRDNNVHELSNLRHWWQFLTNQHEIFARVRTDFYEFWQQQWDLGQVDTILPEVQDKTYQWKFPINWHDPFPAVLHYQEPPPKGKKTGRYIFPTGDEPDQYADEHVLQQVDIGDATRSHIAR